MAVGSLLDEQPKRFIADAMLGRLTRWLRILGYDTAYEKVIADEVLIERALREERWVLTRDGYLAQRKVLRGRHTLLASDTLEDQLHQLHQDLRIDLNMRNRRRCRCADCNVALALIPHDEAAPLVPPYVARRYRDFLRCPCCRRVFWLGTHWQDLVRRLAVIGEEDAAGP